MTNLDSILKNRDITLPTKVRIIKAVVFPVVMCGCGFRRQIHKTQGSTEQERMSLPGKVVS